MNPDPGLPWRQLSPQIIHCAAVLCDLDGVLIASEAVFERHWLLWAAAHGVDGPATLALGQGIRTSDHIRAVTPHLDADREALKLEQGLAHDTTGITAYPGALAIATALPLDSWAIVTSSTRPLALSRLAAAGLFAPPTLVTGEMVTNGKPDPEGYLHACRLLNVRPQDAVVIEDAPPGIDAAHAAGALAIAVPTTHTLDQLRKADLVASLTHITPRQITHGRIVLSVS